MTGYVERHPPEHVCAPPRDPVGPDAPQRHDTWRCSCGRLFYCSGWILDFGMSYPWWHRVPTSPWLSARWIRRFWGTFVSPPS